MNRSILFGALAACALSAACGGGTEATGGAGGATSSTSTSSTTTTPTGTTSSTSTSSTVTTGTGGKTFCSDGYAIVFGDYLNGDLATTGQKDLYRFTGQKGQVVMLDIDAQVLDDAQYDPDHIDPVLTLFDANGTQLAQNNDPIEFSTGDSRLYTILPADGEYCARVADCWSVLSNPASNCDAPKDKLYTAYAIYLYEITDEAGDANTAEVEAGDDAASATTLDYAMDESAFYQETFWGTFRDQDDIDVFAFTMPTDLDTPPPADARTNGRFYMMTSGTASSGSTAPTGKVWVADAGDPTATLASIDASKNPRFQPRLELGKPYLLYVTRPKGTTGANDFYLGRHYPSWGNPLEAEILLGTGTGENDTLATAETIPVDLVDGYVEGDLTMNVADVDYFVAAVPFGAVTVSLSCGAQRYGSGLRGLKASLLRNDGTPLAAGASDVETETHFTSISPVSVGTQMEVIVKVEAASQDPMVSSSFYQCGIHFQE